MTPVALTLLVAGVAVVAAASVGALLLRDTRTRLHALTAVSTVGGPLVILAVAVDGSATTAVQALLVGVLLASTGPVLGAATGRLVRPPRDRRDPR
ncbi:MAG: monovalent cation/H(+) antiporter subunit G [Actinomycetota bacterium]|nr:monovalent cation/H(+) antiporter subunit G [Actinomycetota bacterium]